MELNRVVSENIGIVAVLLGVVALVALVLAALLASRIGVVVRRFSWVQDHAGEGPDSLATLLGAVQGNARAVARLDEHLAAVVADGRTHFKRVGLVRYDAFDGVAGQQSYSLCLLDDIGNGVLISNLVGSNFNRGYAVEVRAGQASRKLGDEERHALAAAMSDDRAAASAAAITHEAESHATAGSSGAET